MFNLTFQRIYSPLIRNTFLLAVMFIFGSNPAHAKDSVPDKFSIAIGGYWVYRYDATASLTDPDIGAGISISPQDTLGLDSEQTVFRLTGHYRFNREHALSYSWYSISSNGNKTIEEEFDWVDENGDPITIPVGAQVDSSFDYDIFKISYLWSFYHTDKVEIATGAGLHMARIALNLNADTTSSGIEAEKAETSIPLPVVSIALTYHVTPKFNWIIKSEAFALKFDDWDGLYTDVTLAMEYRAFKNVGLGIGIGSNALKVEEDAPDQKFVFDNRISGVLFYAAAHY